MTTTQESTFNLQPLSISEERAIREALAVMTPGPWYVLHGAPRADEVFIGEQSGVALWNEQGALYNANDATGIVTIRNSAPRLLATITALRDRVTQEASAVSAWQQKHSAVSGQIRARDAWADDLVRRFAIDDGSGSFVSKEVHVERALREHAERIAFLEKTRDELQTANTREVEARRVAEAGNQELTDELGDWQNRMSIARAEAQKERDRVAGLVTANKMLTESNAELTRRLAVARGFIAQAMGGLLVPGSYLTPDQIWALLSNALAAIDAPEPFELPCKTCGHNAAYWKFGYDFPTSCDCCNRRHTPDTDEAPTDPFFPSSGHHSAPNAHVCCEHDPQKACCDKHPAGGVVTRVIDGKWKPDAPLPYVQSPVCPSCNHLIHRYLCRATEINPKAICDCFTQAAQNAYKKYAPKSLPTEPLDDETAQQVAPPATASRVCILCHWLESDPCLPVLCRAATPSVAHYWGGSRA